MKDCKILLNTLQGDDNYTQHQQDYFDERYKELTAVFPMKYPWAKNLLHLFIESELMIKKLFREINLASLDEKQKYLEMLSQAQHIYTQFEKSYMEYRSCYTSKLLKKAEEQVQELQEKNRKLEIRKGMSL